MAQYPPPPNQVYTPAPQPAPQQRSNTWLIVLIAVLVVCCVGLLILGGCAVYLGPTFQQGFATGFAGSLTGTPLP